MPAVRGITAPGRTRSGVTSLPRRPLCTGDAAPAAGACKAPQRARARRRDRLESKGSFVVRRPLLDLPNAAGTLAALTLRRMKLCLGKLGRSAPLRTTSPLSSVLGIACSVAGLLWSECAHADTAVMPVEGRNVTQGDADAIGRLFADAYAVVSRERVVAPRPLDLEADFAPVSSDEAKRVGADEYVVIYAVGLGEKVKLRATRYALDGTVIHGARMDAASLDDLDVVTERLAKALWLEVAPRETRTPDTVTEQESKPKRRLSSEKVMGIKASYVHGFATGMKLKPMLGFGFDGRIESESYFIEFGVGALIPAQSHAPSREGYGGIYSEFGASYYFVSSEISPYVGAGFLPRFIITDESAGAQFSAYGQLGLMFMRSSSTRLYVDARVAQSLTPVSFGSYYGDDGSDARPLEVGLQVGIGW